MTAPRGLALVGWLACAAGVLACTHRAPAAGPSPVRAARPAPASPLVPEKSALGDVVDPACTPRTCGELQASCGDLPDGCGRALHCGTCAAPLACGAGGNANVCEAPSTDSTAPTLAAAGDIACDLASERFGRDDECQQAQTAKLAREAHPAAVLLLGDNQYPAGELASYQRSFDKSWGKLGALLHPSPGNHEYLLSGAHGYYDYFGAAAGPGRRGYYSFDVGAWHLVSLNSNCRAAGCEKGSEQERWLRADLAAHRRTCTLAYFHHPRFSSGVHGNNPAVAPLWDALYEAGADVVLNGHDHDYERFRPQRPDGRVDEASGLREFVVGTGGFNHYLLPHAVVTSEVRRNDEFGVLLLTLHPASYEWRFVSPHGVIDSGAGTCH